MTACKDRRNRFGTVFGVPDFIEPWLDRFFEPEEIELVLLLADRPLDPARIAKQFHCDHGQKPPADLASFLSRARKRGVVNRLEDGRFEPADFHARYEIWALFEGWQDIPQDLRQRLNAWELAVYSKTHRPDIAALKASRRDPAAVCPEYLLLDEAEALLDIVDHVYLWPCNCRAMVQACGKALITCLRFSNSRGLGWEISKNRAKAVLNDADRAGLMHSAEIGVAPDGTIEGAICNCCADCCFPHQLAERENAQKLWPLTRHMARRLKQRCTRCGRCVQRCPFGAFGVRRAPRTGSGLNAIKGRQRKQVVFYRRRCRGCGLCASGCPEDAIVMDRLENEWSLWDKIRPKQVPRQKFDN